MAAARGTYDPIGIRAGDRRALDDLVRIRGDSVIAYCMELAGADSAGRAAAEAMARFRSALVVLGDDTRVTTDVLLLAATRHAAAASAELDTLWAGARIQERDPPCEMIPTMLAARAVGQLGSADLDRVAKHLWRCEGCRLVQAAFGRAEQAYRDPTVDPTPDEAGTMLRALRSAAPSTQNPDSPVAGAEREPGPDILGTVEPSGFLDEADFDPRNQPTVIFDVLQPAGETIVADATPAKPATHEFEPIRPDTYVPGKSATFTFSLLALVAVIVVLGLAYAIDGLPGSGDDAKRPTVTHPVPPRDPTPTTPATG